MTDRFKFRFWNKSKNRYVNTEKLVLNDGTYTQVGTKQMNNGTYCSYIVNEYNFSDIIQEQCTGLKDKNDKLIYEGDWLKTKDGYYCYVVWFEGFWWVKSLPSEAMDLEHAEFYKECEIVGNIHENADLLGEDK